MIMACLGIYFKPVVWGLNEALHFPPLKSFDTAAGIPAAMPALPEPIPTSPNARCRAKINEAAELIDKLKQKKRGIYELIRYYRIGITDLESKIIKETRGRQLVQYAGAIKHRRIELSLRTIQRRQDYIGRLEKSRQRIHRGREKLLYLKRKTQVDLELIDIAGGIDLARYTEQLDLAIEELRLTAENSPLELPSADSLPLEMIWSRIVKPITKTAPQLIGQAGIKAFKSTGPGTLSYADLSAFRRKISKRLPRYSRLIKAAAHKHGFDWHLIAAQIYQESHFNPQAKSRAGARGMMQILPGTARSLGLKNSYDAVENINAGVRYLKTLYDNYRNIADYDRMMLALAAYNAGRGHVEDARRLAAQKGLNPDSWESLRNTLPLLRYRKYYKKLKHGYCRGTEPVNYAKRIMIFYNILKQQETECETVQAKL